MGLCRSWGNTTAGSQLPIGSGVAVSPALIPKAALLLKFELHAGLISGPHMIATLHDWASNVFESELG